MSALRWNIHPSLHLGRELWWLVEAYGSSWGAFFFFFYINLVLSRRSRWPKKVEWNHLGLTVLMISIGWKDTLSDTASALPRRSNVWDKIYSSADMSLTGIKRWKASVLTYWTAPFCPAAAPLPRIDDRNCPFAASQSSSCKYSNGAYAGAPQNPDS